MFIGIGKCYRIDYVVLTLLCLMNPLAVAEQPVLQIHNAWIKLAPPGATANAVYLEFVNPNNKPVVITALQSSCCSSLMFHRTRYKNNQARMEHMDELIIPAADHVQLKPGGMHIMLMHASPPLQLGNLIDINLSFSDGQQQKVSIPVRANNDE